MAGTDAGTILAPGCPVEPYLIMRVCCATASWANVLARIKRDGWAQQVRAEHGVAEELLRSAGRAGLPVAIYRPLDIVGSLRTGVWNTATEMCALIRFITDTRLAPTSTCRSTSCPRTSARRRHGA